MSALKGRLRRLEEAARGGACAVCGLPPGGPNYTVDRGEPMPENPEEECPRCGRCLWWVWEVEMPKALLRLRAFAEEAMRRDHGCWTRTAPRSGCRPWGPSGSGSRRGRSASRRRG